MTAFHPDLYPTARFLPRSVRPEWIVRCLRLREMLHPAPKVPKAPHAEGVNIDDIYVPSLTDAHPTRVRLLRPASAPGPTPALLWLHGGGFVMGDSEIDETNNIDLVRETGITVAAVNYRLAPRHPFPTPVEDCYAALRWLHSQPNVRTDRIAIGGSSAGAGLAAGLVLMAHDRADVPVAFQLLIYPMLDDRTALRTDIDMSNIRLWNNACNRFGWRSYLKKEPGSPDVHPYAAPARRTDLSGLPPTWMGMGTFDLFHDEDLEYAQRLQKSGVPCELQVVKGAYHGFDLFSPKTNVVREFRQSYIEALKRALKS